jgi:hypothetical protein
LNIYYGDLSFLKKKIAEDNENWLLIFKNSARRGFLASGSNGKTILGPREEKSWTTLL